MKKIDGVLYGPATSDHREKMYVETVTDAVVMEDGTTLQEKLNTKSNSIILSVTQPDFPCIWFETDIDPVENFDFSDITAEIEEDDTTIHTLRTPADKNGIREKVYPLTDAKNVKVGEGHVLNDYLKRYDMGVEVGRAKPSHKAMWCVESYKTAEIVNEEGRKEDVVLLNDFLATDVVIGAVDYHATDYVFDVNDEKMVIFNSKSDIVELNQTTPNKSCLWLNDLYHVYPDEPNVAPFLTNRVIIDDVYEADNGVIHYDGEDYVFLDNDTTRISDDVPKVHNDTIWADTSDNN